MFQASNRLVTAQSRQPGNSRTLGVFSSSAVLMAFAVVCCLPASTAIAAGRIILRNTKIYRNPVIVKMDQDGVALQGGTTLTWDVIESGKLDAKQAEFDGFLKDLGNNLFRIRQRMEVGDYKGLLMHAEKVYARYRGRSSDTALMVCHALMWSRLSHGQREMAVEPYLQAFELVRTSKRKGPPGRRALRVDMKTGISEEILPVWFDAAAAKKSLPAVVKTIAKMKKPVPEGIRIYYGTLALAAGDSENLPLFLTK